MSDNMDEPTWAEDHPDNAKKTALCVGGCGKTVTEAGKICSSCWYPGSDPVFSGAKWQDRISHVTLKGRGDVLHAHKWTISDRVHMVPRHADVVCSCGSRLCIDFEPAPKESDPVPPVHASNSDLRPQVMHSAYKLACGTKAEQAEALTTLALLVSIIQQEQHQTNKET